MPFRRIRLRFPYPRTVPGTVAPLAFVQEEIFVKGPHRDAHNLRMRLPAPNSRGCAHGSKITVNTREDEYMAYNFWCFPGCGVPVVGELILG